MNNKSVFIFGAGASAAAKLPIQNQILEQIFDIKNPPLSNSFIEDNMLAEQYSNFIISRRYLCDFLINTFCNSDTKNFYISIFKNKCEKFTDIDIEEEWYNVYTKVKCISISLEDIYTMLDKASILKECLNSYEEKNIYKIKNCLNNCILYVISYAINQSKDLKLYDKIAQYFVNRRLKTEQKEDPFSIITMNWDTLLDSHIYNLCKKNNISQKDTKATKFILPDYCCYNYDLHSNIPSTQVKAKGNYNIKIMKLHGSINWLYCSNCGRLYSDFSNNISLQSINGNSVDCDKIKCRFCSNNNKKFFLKPIIITPTFLKDFNNLHLKTIWHNAYLDLCEADEIIFIGYSFPDADFELRYILKRALNSNVKIKVILHNNDDPKQYQSILKNLDINIAKKIENKLNLPHYRYKNFFSNHKIIFSYNGIEDFFDKLILKK